MIGSNTLLENLEILTLEIILDKMKILSIDLYKPPYSNEKNFLFHLNNAYNFFCSTYENTTLIGDFNMKPENQLTCVKLINLNILRASSLLLLTLSYLTLS